MKKEDLYDRMAAIRAAAGHRDLRPPERCLLAILVTYQNFREDPIFAKGWMVSRRRLSEDLYGRADKTSLRNLDRLLVSLHEKGFIEAIGTARRANTYAVTFDRLHTHNAEEVPAEGSPDARPNTSDGPTDDGPVDRPPLGPADRQKTVCQTDPPRSDRPTSSTEKKYPTVATTSLPSSDPERPGADECQEQVATHAREVELPNRLGWLVEGFGMLDVNVAESEVDAVVAAFGELEGLFAGLDASTQSTALRMVTNVHHQDPVGAVGWVRRLVESQGA